MLSAGHATYDNIIWHMHFACWITKATDAHSEYVILFAFLQQQMLHRCATFYIICTLSVLLVLYSGVLG